jgi:hypothetical protein
MYLLSGAVAGAVVLAVVGAAVVGAAVHQGLAFVGAAVGLPVVPGAADVGTGMRVEVISTALQSFAHQCHHSTHRHSGQQTI